MAMQLDSIKRTGRGAVRDLPNRFEKLAMDLDPDVVQDDPDIEGAILPNPKTIFLEDHSESIIVKNDSPDVGFSAGINPYRGCEHGCAYCYARPYHEYLGFSAGLEFETKIMVKRRAAELLRRELSKPEVPAAGPRHERRHRLLPARRATIPHHPLVPGGARGIPQSGLAHHKKFSRHARHRCAQGTRGLRCRACLHLDHDPERGPRRENGTAREPPRASPARDRDAGQGGHSGRRDGRADRPGPQRPRNSCGARGGESGGCDRGRLHACCACPTA